jgi:hypothetical protein
MGVGTAWIGVAAHWCPFSARKQAAHARLRLGAGDVGVDAEGHPRIAVVESGDC